MIRSERETQSNITDRACRNNIKENDTSVVPYDIKRNGSVTRNGNQKTKND